MKKQILILALMLSIISGISAQNVDDALRYSQNFYSGTARFMSMGGAFTALGGDVSTLGQNPAGIGVFRSSEISLSPQMYHIKTISGFNSTNTEDYRYNFNLGQAGIVMNLIKNNSETGLVTLNFGYNYNRSNNFYQSAIIKGMATRSSLTDAWADISYGYYKDELSSEVPDAYLAYRAALIDTLPGYDWEYASIFAYYGDKPYADYGQQIRRIITTEGGVSEHSFSIGGNYSNKIFFGATLGISKINYSNHYEHLETAGDINPYDLKNFNYIFRTENTGTGYSLKIGTIIRPVETIRLGLAFHSPTLYKIDEIISDNITSEFTDGEELYFYNSSEGYNYSLLTPFRAIAGIAVQIKKIGLVSADYEFIDYSTARFSETGDGWDYTDKNHIIKSSLDAASNIRLGAEIRLNKLYLRGGYGLYGKPFAEGELNENMNYNSVSFGLGFREQNIILDLGYTSLSNTQKYIMYDSIRETALTNMNINRNMFTFTLGYKFGY